MSWEVITGDCLEVMPTLEANSVDTIITDPPYGLSFMGKDWDHGVPGEHFWREALRVAKPGAMLLAFGGTRTFHRLAVAIEDAGGEIRDVLMWVYATGFPKSHDIGKAIDKAAGAERERNLVPSRSGNAVRRGEGEQGATYGDSHGGFRDLSAPATDAAKQWDGWGTALKPAWEPIIVAMKPLDGTFAQNAQAHGVAGLWIDGGRVGTEQTVTLQNGNSGGNGAYGRDERVLVRINPPGRWPANLIHDGSDEVVGLFPWTNPARANKISDNRAVPFYQAGDKATEGTSGRRDPNNSHDDTGGSAARFFYTAKASRGERNAGLEGIEPRPGHVSYDPRYHEGGGKLPPSPGNHHPTVKPIALMRYLARLTKTPTGGVVLDPFAGSGSTGIGAVLEGRSFIGIEREEEYAEIARRRIEHWAAQVVQPALLETE